MRYGLLLAAVLSAGCGLFGGDGECDPTTEDCSETSFCCTPRLTLQCSSVALEEGRKLQLLVEVGGGSRPYAYTVNWGHGDEERGSRLQAGLFTLEHAFPGQSQQYSIRVAARDGDNATATCELSHTVSGPSAPGG